MAFHQFHFALFARETERHRDTHRPTHTHLPTNTHAAHNPALTVNEALCSERSQDSGWRWPALLCLPSPNTHVLKSPRFRQLLFQEAPTKIKSHTENTPKYARTHARTHAYGSSPSHDRVHLLRRWYRGCSQPTCGRAWVREVSISPCVNPGKFRSLPARSDDWLEMERHGSRCMCRDDVVCGSCGPSWHQAALPEEVDL